MRNADEHLSDEDLLLAADGELPAGRAKAAQAHLASCWTCRTRMHETESAIADFVRARQMAAPDLPPPEAARVRLRSRLAQQAAMAPSLLHQRALTVGAVGALVAVAALIALASHPAVEDARPLAVKGQSRAIPDPDLTPGAVLPLASKDLCGAGAVESTRIVPAAVAQQVFAAYGIAAPQPRAYEVDYLITPALGGSDNIRNFWPQPYGNTGWNAHIKDALEDRLVQLVCGGQLDLATAQREIAKDWIATYKKYFRTDRPLPEHRDFLKDRPWE